MRASQTQSGTSATAPLRGRGRPRTSGQVLVMLIMAVFVLVGLIAIVIDVSWLWANSLRVQRAADAAALAGVVWLPGDSANGRTVARAEATKNGYTHLTAGAVVNADPDATNPTRMIASVSAPVRTYFMRVFGINSITISRTGKAEYALPVPMGSPLNYYGVFGTIRAPVTAADSGYRVPTTVPPPSGWTNPVNAYTSDNIYAQTTALGTEQGYGNFGFVIPAAAVISGIEVRIEAQADEPGFFGSSGCRIAVSLSSNAGGTWTGVKNSDLSDSDSTDTLGGSNDLWGGAWTIADFTDANFVLKVRSASGGSFFSSCDPASTFRLDRVQVRVYWSANGTVDQTGPPAHGSPILIDQGFFGSVMSQGGVQINGDFYGTKYTNVPTLNPNYAPTKYYNYGVELLPASSNGEVWIFDPVFCDTGSTAGYGAGDRWFSGTNGISTYYELFDTNNTPYTEADDGAPIASSGTLFQNISASDASLGGSGGSSCQQGAVSDPADGRYWHNRWWLLASGLAGGTTYRLKVGTTDPANANAQNNANAHNQFSIWTTATGTLPRVYGLGTMVAFSPVDGGGASVFYLGQIQAANAGQAIRIKLWDPGDTQALDATLQILRPETAGYAPATFNWTSARGNPAGSGVSNCNGLSGSNVTSVVTNTGGSSRFNGCMLTITVAIPDTYTAPLPEGEPPDFGGGWWKIQYNMGGNADDNATDLTTWQMSLVGNPVHLVVP